MPIVRKKTVRIEKTSVTSGFQNFISQINRQYLVSNLKNEIHASNRKKQVEIGFRW